MKGTLPVVAKKAAPAVSPTNTQLSLSGGGSTSANTKYHLTLPVAPSWVCTVHNRLHATWLQRWRIYFVSNLYKIYSRISEPKYDQPPTCSGNLSWLIDTDKAWWNSHLNLTPVAWLIMPMVLQITCWQWWWRWRGNGQNSPTYIPFNLTFNLNFNSNLMPMVLQITCDDEEETSKFSTYTPFDLTFMGAPMGSFLC